MTRYTRWIPAAALTLGLGLSLPTLALADPAGELASRLQKLDTLQASFVQVSQAVGKQAGSANAGNNAGSKANQKPPQTVSGTLAVRKPRLFRWEVTSPYQQLIVSDGKDLRTYDPDLMQMTVRAVGDTWSQTPALLFSGDVRGLSKSFAVTQQHSGDIDTFVLKPLARDAVFAELDLQFKGSQPYAMHLLDSMGQQTDITFTDVKVGGSIATDKFKFTPPSGTDVVRE